MDCPGLLTQLRPKVNNTPPTSLNNSPQTSFNISTCVCATTSARVCLLLLLWRTHQPMPIWGGRCPEDTGNSTRFTFYCVMNGIQQFAANIISYIPTKYYQNWSTSDLVIVKTKRVNFCWNTVHCHSQGNLNGRHLQFKVAYWPALAVGGKLNWLHISFWMYRHCTVS